MDKRTFLRNAASLFLAPLAGRALAAPAAGKSRFLLVFLRGGYDAANVLIPVSNGFYYESRPNIAVARESVLPLTSEWGLHPALGDTVYRLYQNGQAAFIPFAGHGLHRPADAGVPRRSAGGEHGPQVHRQAGRGLAPERAHRGHVPRHGARRAGQRRL